MTDRRHRRDLRLTVMAALAVCLAAALVPAKASAGAYADGLKPKKLIVAVGIDQFQDPLWHQLRFARRDAQSIYDFFTAKSVGFDGGELLNAPAGVKTGDVLAALSRLDHENRNEEDTVVIYLSMHGTVAYKPDGHVGRYIITSDTNSQSITKTALDYDAVMEAFARLKSRRKVLILAFCHSGVGKSALTPEMKRALAQLKGAYFEEPLQERSEGSIILTASGWQEPALEDEQLGGDVYTHFLLEGLQQTTDMVTITSAHDYAAQRTYAYTHGRQRPSAIVELLGSDPVVIRGNQSGHASAKLYSLMQRFAPLKVYLDDQSKGTLEKGLALPPGSVRLRLEDPDTGQVVVDRILNVREGKEYSVADLLQPRYPHSLVIGAANLAVLSAGARRLVAPKATSGAWFRYEQDEVFSAFGLAISGAYFPVTTEQIPLASDINATQTRRGGEISAMAVDHERLHWLSSSHQRVLTDARLALGPNAIYLDRQVQDAASSQSHGTVWSPGLAAAVGLDCTFPYDLVRLSIAEEFSAGRNMAATSGILQETRLFTVGLGTFW